MHNTTENYTFIRDSCKGVKKVDNYIKTIWEPTYAILNDPRSAKEDVEAVQIDRERRKELLESYVQVERIFAEKTEKINRHSEFKYYCKWKELPYSEATWEVSLQDRCRPCRENDRNTHTSIHATVARRPARFCQAGH